MTSDSKIFVGLKPIRSKAAPRRDTNVPQCQWDDCQNGGTHRAPVGRDGEGLYLLFCSKHAKEYNSGYNFAVELSDPVVARYQREAASGSRRTLGTNVKQTSEAPLPSTARSGSAKTINARKNAAQRQATKVDVQRRKLKVLEAKAFETLQLPEDATPEEIRARYKQRLKMLHPDVNQGDRNSEDQLRETIEAFKILKLNDFC
jgi:hypothetical protein